MSYVMPRRRRSSTISALLLSTNSRGGMPCLSASYVIGVPCSSVPLAMRTREPRSRSNRARTSAGTANPATCPMWRGPLAYGHAGATRTVLIRSGATDHKRKLAARALAQGCADLGRGSSQHLLVHLRQLPRDRQPALWQDLGDDRERFENAIGRIEGNGRTRFAGKALEEAAHLTWLAREVADKKEPLASVARDRQRGGDCARSRDGHHGVPCRPRCVDK